MIKKLNFISLILSFICVALFFISTSSKKVVNFSTNLLGIHPLNIVLVFCIITFLLGIIGLLSINSWKLLLSSILTIVITIALSAFIFFVLGIGHLLV